MPVGEPGLGLGRGEGLPRILSLQTVLGGQLCSPQEPWHQQGGWAGRLGGIDVSGSPGSRSGCSLSGQIPEFGEFACNRAEVVFQGADANIHPASGMWEEKAAEVGMRARSRHGPWSTLP